jgi:hypothetical protein
MTTQQVDELATELEQVTNDAFPETIPTPISDPVVPKEDAGVADVTSIPSPTTTEEPTATEPSPYELPAEAVYEPTPPPTGALTDAERYELEYHRKQDQERAVTSTAAQLDRYQQQALDHYQNVRGFDPETADVLAQAHRDEREASLTRELDYRAERATQDRTQQDAIEIANQFNVNPRALSGFTRKEDMARYAKLLGYTASVDKRLLALEKKAIPEQPFVDGGHGSGNGTQFTRQQLADMTPEQFEVARPNIVR